MRGIAVASIEVLICLWVWTAVQMNPPAHRSTPSIDTLGRYAIDMSWPGKLDQDMDLWCQDPSGAVAWFASRDAGALSLQHDDLGTLDDPTKTNHERMIVRYVTAGEYVCNVHVYRKETDAPTRVMVTLTRLAGADAKVYSRTLEMGVEGDEQTAFRFTLNQGGKLVGMSTLAKSLVYAGSAP